MSHERPKSGSDVRTEKDLKEGADKLDKAIRDTLSENAKRQRNEASRFEKQKADNIIVKLGETETLKFKKSAADSVPDYGSMDLIQFSIDDSGDDPSSSEELKKDAKALKEKNPDAKKKSAEEKNLYAQFTIASASLVSALVGGGSLFMSIWLYVAAKKEADGRNDDLPPGLSDAEIKRLVEAWRAKPDADFWSETANYVERNQLTLSLTDEINILKVIQSMSLNTGWSWEPAAFNVAVNDFMGDISKTKNTAVAYRMVTERKYAHDDAPGKDPEVMHRRVAAEVLAQAIARFMRTSGGATT
jgi:hypothetical protein